MDRTVDVTIPVEPEARAAGLTDADTDAELAAYNAERRDRRTTD